MNKIIKERMKNKVTFKANSLYGGLPTSLSHLLTIPKEPSIIN